MAKNPEEKLTLPDFYQRLPDEILKNAGRLKIDVNVKKNIINEIVPEDKIERDGPDFNKTGNKYKALSLDERQRSSKISKEARKLKFNQRKKKEKQLTAKQRHNLFKIDKSTNLRYEVFVEINKLWRNYINNLIKLSPKGKDAQNESVKNRNNIYNCLVKADYHGALVVVAEAKNPLLVGLKGIVIKESKKVFYLINESNRILGESGLSSYEFVVQNAYPLASVHSDSQIWHTDRLRNQRPNLQDQRQSYPDQFAPKNTRQI